MNRTEICDYLRERNIWFEITEHRAVYNMEELSQVTLPYPESEAKNLFVRDDKKREYYLITVKGDKRVDLREFRRNHGTRPLSFASERDLMEMMGLAPGAVTPFGLLNDTERRIHFFLDDDFLAPPGLIGVHPNDNTATVWMKTDCLISVLQEYCAAIHLIQA